MDLSNIFHFDLYLRFSDIDSANIAYFARYPSFFDESFIAALNASGITWQTHMAEDFLLPIVEQQTKYYHPLKTGDVAKIYMTVTNRSKRSFTCSHLIMLTKDGEDIMVASGYITRVITGHQVFKAREAPPILDTMLQKHTADPQEWEALLQQYRRK